MAVVEIRCPNNAARLFMKLKLEGKKPHINEDNLMEFACQDCRRIRRNLGEDVKLVLHRYDFLGTLVETEVT